MLIINNKDLFPVREQKPFDVDLQFFTLLHLLNVLPSVLLHLLVPLLLDEPLPLLLPLLDQSL